MIKIRRALATDVSAVAELSYKLTRQHQSYNELRFVSFENHEQKLRELFELELQNPAAVMAVAELENKIVGYAFVRAEAASLIEISQPSAWLHDIYLDESARGQNGGKMLLDAAVNAARELDSKVLMLHVSPRNEFARKLFEKYGFVETMRELMLDLNAQS